MRLKLMYRFLVTLQVLALHVLISDAHNNSTSVNADQCPSTVGHVTDDVIDLSSSSNTMTHLLLNASFRCRAHVRSWIYFRSRASPRIYAAVWRREPYSDDYFRLVGMNVLPAGDVGWHSVAVVGLKDRIRVEPGDFIGFHYSGADVYRFNERGALAVDISPGTRRADDKVPAYATLMAGYYNENFHVDMPHTFLTSDRRLLRTSPALQAVLDYTEHDGATGRCESSSVVNIRCPAAAAAAALAAPAGAVMRIRQAIHRVPSSSCSGRRRTRNGRAVTSTPTSASAASFSSSSTSLRTFPGGCTTNISRDVAGVCDGRLEECGFELSGGAVARVGPNSRGEYVDVGFSCVTSVGALDVFTTSSTSTSHPTSTATSSASVARDVITTSVSPFHRFTTTPGSSFPADLTSTTLPIIQIRSQRLRIFPVNPRDSDYDVTRWRSASVSGLPAANRHRVVQNVGLMSRLQKEINSSELFYSANKSRKINEEYAATGSSSDVTPGNTTASASTVSVRNATIHPVTSPPVTETTLLTSAMTTSWSRDVTVTSSSTVDTANRKRTTNHSTMTSSTTVTVDNRYSMLTLGDMTGVVFGVICVCAFIAVSIISCFLRSRRKRGKIIGNLVQSRVIENHLQQNPIYAQPSRQLTTSGHSLVSQSPSPTVSNTLSHHHQQHQQHHHPSPHQYEQLDSFLLPVDRTSTPAIYTLLNVAVPMTSSHPAASAGNSDVTTSAATGSSSQLMSYAAGSSAQRPIFIIAGPGLVDSGNGFGMWPGGDGRGGLRDGMIQGAETTMPSTSGASRCLSLHRPSDFNHVGPASSASSSCTARRRFSDVIGDRRHPTPAIRRHRTIDHRSNYRPPEPEMDGDCDEVAAVVTRSSSSASGMSPDVVEGRRGRQRHNSTIDAGSPRMGCLTRPGDQKDISRNSSGRCGCSGATSYPGYTVMTSCKPPGLSRGRRNTADGQEIESTTVV